MKYSYEKKEKILKNIPDRMMMLEENINLGTEKIFNVLFVLRERFFLKKRGLFHSEKRNVKQQSYEYYRHIHI